MHSQDIVRSKPHDSKSTHGDTERRLPYIGRVLRYQPDCRIDIGYTLDLDEDLYLKHHMFVHAPGIKPPSACLPILPMTFGLEMMAEAAACLAPGLGLIGFEKVTALDWVGLRDTATLPLILTAQLDSDNPQQMSRKIKVGIYKEGAALPAMKCHVLLGKHYLLSVALTLEELIAPHPLAVTVEQFYGERFVFHGPLLHCISGIHAVGENGLTGEVRLFQTGNLFRSTIKPELLTHPAFMDGVAQLLAAWFLDKEAQALPLGIETMEIYRPTPKPGQNLPVSLQITKITHKTISVDLEIHDGEGGVWIRIKNWKYWILHHTRILTDFIRLPEKFPGTTELPDSPEGTVGREISRDALRDMDLEWLARTLLHTNEMPIFKELKRDLPRRQAWLLQRLAAKDAVRHWIATETSGDMIHPASFCLETGSNGTLSIKENPAIRIMPKVTTAGSKDHAIAIAHKEHVDISLENLNREFSKYEVRNSTTSKGAAGTVR